MSMIDDQETLQIFIEDSQEHLSGIESDLLAIEAAGENMDIDLVNKVFRAVHSIKGGAGFLGLETIKALAHDMENLLNMMRNRELVPTSVTISTLLDAADMLKRLINNPATSNEVDIAIHLSALKSAAGAILPKEDTAALVAITHPDGHVLFTLAAAELEQARKGGKELYVLSFDFIRDMEAKHKTPLDVIRELQQTGVVVDSKIDLTAVGELTLDEGTPHLPFYALFATLLEADLLAGMLNLDASQIRPWKPASVAPLAPSPVPAPSVAAPPVAPVVPAAPHPAPDVVVSFSEPTPVETPTPLPAPSLPVTVKPAAASTPASDLAKAALSESSLRVNVKVLDTLMTLAGELVLTRNQLVQAVSSGNTQAIETTVQRVDLVTSELQEAIMSTRMQPIGTVFNKFQRVVRDMSRDLHKEVALVIEGEEVELDKTIIEAIGDPLTHLVRNSMDHGIETPEKRRQTNKKPQATVALRARHEAGQVIIEVSDDGGGIATNRIKEKALQMGLYDQAQLAAMSEKEVMKIIFLPGFSTAQKLTDISGRGVGMDVVFTNLTKIGGTIDVESTIGQGTTFHIKLPLTLAIIPSQLVAVGEERFAIPQVNLVELVRVPAVQIPERLERLGDAMVMRQRGALLPLLYLRDVLGIERTAEAPQETAINIVVVATGSMAYGLIVDQLHDSEEIVVKPLGQHLQGCKVYAGATIQGDGRVALILDVGGISTKMHLSHIGETTDEKALTTSGERQKHRDVQSLLIVKNAAHEQFAIPLGLVSRIEKVRCSAIEVTGGRQNIQYRGGNLVLLSIEDVARVSPREDREDLAVVVFQTAGREVGLLVSQIVEVTEVEAAFDDVTFRQPGILGSAIILGTTTLLLDLFGIVEVLLPESVVKPHLVETAGDTPPTLLIVEDSNFFLHHIKSFVEEAGYRAITAQDGVQALEQLEAYGSDISLVLTDIEMPNLDGLGLTQRIRNDERFAHLPVIALTSVAGEAAEKRGLAAGIDDYLIKLDKEKVVERIAYRLTASHVA
jgi:two-component system chemotaxis sensor kinase CheA